MVIQVARVFEIPTAVDVNAVSNLVTGEDDQFEGHLKKTAGLVVSHLEQEPRLDSGATVDENIQPAVKRVRDMVLDFEKVSVCRTLAQVVQ